MTEGRDRMGETSPFGDIRPLVNTHCTCVQVPHAWCPVHQPERFAESLQLGAAIKPLMSRIVELEDALREIERHCPCGARPGSFDTHPHVIGCPVARGLGSPTVADNYRKAVDG